MTIARYHGPETLGFGCAPAPPTPRWACARRIWADQLPRMRDFLILLGSSPRISRRDVWIDMVGGSGMTGVHSTAVSSWGAPPGATGLSFEVVVRVPGPDGTHLTVPCASLFAPERAACG